MKMIKNFSPGSLGINGRQTELLELALTYAFNGIDIDMHEMLRRSQRTDVADAAKYLEAARKAFKIRIGGFDLGINLDADEETFTAQVATLHPLAELAKELGITRAYVRVPAATDRLPYHEYFDVQTARLKQIADLLAVREIKLGIGFAAGKELEEGKEFPFIRNVEGFIALVKAVGSTNVGFYIDTWDWVVGDGAMDQLSELTADEIVAVRLCSLRPESDPATAKSNERVVPTQEGLLDHVKVITHLVEIGFTGPVSPGASGASYKGQTRESIVQRGQVALDEIFTAAGLTVAPLPKDLIEDIPYEPNPIG
ncbi:sugar phosphate isomerase/epimerase family protein [Rubripirellula lacrimiformis]|nr:sugar phosphate isomerase/epimerase family protein [Rubripirellula lacrimiformis]